eukprot:jgi/Botrbrau1/17639/Bobra.0166s0070.1
MVLPWAPGPILLEAKALWVEPPFIQVVILAILIRVCNKHPSHISVLQIFFAGVVLLMDYMSH